MNKNFKILGAVMLGFMSFSCNNNQGNNSSEATTPVWVEDVQLHVVFIFLIFQTDDDSSGFDDVTQLIRTTGFRIFL